MSQASGFSTGAFLIVALIVILVVSVSVGVIVSPLAVPVVAVPLALVYNQILRRLLLPYWMQQKIASIV